MTSLEELLDSPPDLPIAQGLEHVADALRQRRELVVVAPPGTGKTTLVPPLVARDIPGRIVVTQPRRVAARAAARRMASLLGEPVGRTIGYAVRGERAVSESTRIEVVTAGLLLRRLQHDPELAGVSAVILDEVHERSLDADLLLTLLLDARALREDLTLVAMSATADLTRLPAMLGEGEPAPIIDIPSPIFPLTERWAPPPAGVTRLGPRGVPRDFLRHVAATARHALADPSLSGDLLLFAPGAREVDLLTESLRETMHDLPQAVSVFPLHGRLPSAAQDAALAPATPGTRKVVVSTAVAESSLTVPGVRIVVDATLSREPRVDVATGLSGLVTVGESRASGIQRAGRAAREAPGTVIRCCTPVEWARAAQAPTPEILSSDLTRLALELAAWGAPGGVGLSWLDAPPAAAMEAAQSHLTSLGLAEEGGSLTPLGRAVAVIPAEIGPARALILAATTLGDRRAADSAALLTAGLRAPGGDLTTLARQVRAASSAPWRQESSRLLAALREVTSLLPSAVIADAGPRLPGLGDLPAWLATATSLGTDEAVGLCAALAAPGLIAHRRGPAPAAGTEATYATVSGTGLRVEAGSPLASHEWLAVTEAQRMPGSANALVRAGAPIDEELALAVASTFCRDEEVVRWEGERMRAVRLRRLGAIELSEQPLPSPSPAIVARAVRERCEDDGLSFLPWGEGEGSAAQLRARLALLHRTLGAPWPDMSDNTLLARWEEWLEPAVTAALTGGGKRVDLSRLDLTSAFQALLPWPQAAHLDELVPERLEVPSGSHLRVHYISEQGEWLEQPILATKLQECFGWEESPRIVEGRVPVLLHLLSPAQRPLAVTSDLRSFWAGPYQEVRKEMRGRYPKHPWPEDPWAALPTSRTRRAQGRAH